MQAPYSFSNLGAGNFAGQCSSFFFFLLQGLTHPGGALLWADIRVWRNLQMMGCSVLMAGPGTLSWRKKGWTGWRICEAFPSFAQNNLTRIPRAAHSVIFFVEVGPDCVWGSQWCLPSISISCPFNTSVREGFSKLVSWQPVL